MSREVKQILATLHDFYGAPSALPPTEPFEEVLWDNVAYMANDARRRLAFTVLSERVGTAPEAIMSARQEALIEVAAHGIMATTFADKIRSAAAIAIGTGRPQVTGRRARETGPASSQTLSGYRRTGVRQDPPLQPLARSAGSGLQRMPGSPATAFSQPRWCLRPGLIGLRPL